MFVCVHYVACPALLLLSIIHSSADDLTLPGLASRSQQNLLSSSNLFPPLTIFILLSLCLQQYLSSIVPPHTASMCMYHSLCVSDYINTIYYTTVILIIEKGQWYLLFKFIEIILFYSVVSVSIFVSTLPYVVYFF